jgi:hypothetical protein
MIPAQNNGRLDAQATIGAGIMSTKGKTWKWKEDAPGRKANSEAMKTKLAAGTAGRPFPKKHGLGGTRIYNIWKKMMYRCYKESDPYYYCYGGRGITVSEEWHDVTQFAADMGEPPKGGSIERVDVDKGYSKANCIWLPHRFQSKNRTGWKHTEEGKRRIGEATRKRNLAKAEEK